MVKVILRNGEGSAIYCNAEKQQIMKIQEEVYELMLERENEANREDGNPQQTLEEIKSGSRLGIIRQEFDETFFEVCQKREIEAFREGDVPRVFLDSEYGDWYFSLNYWKCKYCKICLS